MTRAGARGPVVIAGGGTAGHVLPGLAVAEALVRAGVERDQVRIVGATPGMEADLVPPAGFALTTFALRNFPRTVTLAHVGAAARLAIAMVRALMLVRRLRPRAVLSVGGYASVPTVVAAWLWRVPIVNLSYDALPGKASKLAARVARATAVAFPNSALPRPVVTGAPLRDAIAGCVPERDRAAARTALGLPADRLVVGVVGGSLGSLALVRAAGGLAAQWGSRPDLALRLVTGARNVDAAPAARDADDGGLIVQVVPFERHMEHLYAAVDVLVARAGATTVAEIAAVGVPCVLVPWPLAAEDHQSANARWLADVGGALVLTDDDLPERLAETLERLLESPGDRARLAAAARTVGRRDAADAVAALVLKVSG
jgi:UDP-N-acetylglucosamine--N-acetylmuramyl-(pentapeptide) pyrophosphoryl-undecaprenol N-acetylglucosamine transferase